MENKVQNLDWTGICDPWVHLSALALGCWVTLWKLFHLPVCKSPTYEKEVVVYVTLVLITCVRNAAEKEQVWNWINYHLLFSFSCSNIFSSFPVHLGNYLRLMRLSPTGLEEWFLFSFLWPRYSCSAPKSAPTWLQTIFYLALPISHYFSLKWSKTLLPDPSLHSPCDAADRLVSEYHLPASWSFLVSISPLLNWTAMPNVLPAWLIGWPMSSTCLSLWLLLSWACTSLLGHLQPP